MVCLHLHGLSHPLMPLMPPPNLVPVGFPQYFFYFSSFCPFSSISDPFSTFFILFTIFHQILFHQYVPHFQHFQFVPAKGREYPLSVTGISWKLQCNRDLLSALECANITGNICVGHLGVLVGRRGEVVLRWGATW